MDQPERLSHEESRLLAEHLASLAKSGLPLPPGLRAAAQEMPNRRLAAAMFALAQELDAGRSLESALANHPKLMPPHMQRLIETGVRSGNLPNVLVRLVDIDRTSFDLRRNLRQAIAYPLMLFVLLVAVTFFLVVYVVPGMKRVFTDFRTDLPMPTVILLSISDSQALPIIGLAIGAIICCIVLLRLFLPPVIWQRLLTRVPLLGPTLRWRGVANWSRLLGLLLREEIPLPEAAQLAAEGVDSPLMRSQGLRISKALAAGRRLEDAVGSIRSLPASLKPLLRWGEEHGALPEALDSSAEMFETRVQLRAALLRSILPPVTFIFIAMSILMILNAMLMPLMKLITDLSGGFRRHGDERVNIHTIETSALQLLLVLAIVWVVATLLIQAYRLMYGRSANPAARSRSSRTSVRQLQELFRVLYWVVFFLVLWVGMFIVAGVVGILLWFATLVIALMIKVRYAEMERRSLLWALAVAMEKQIPLPACAAAFADECHSSLGDRTRELAHLLERAVPIDAALEKSKIRLPNDALVAVRTGTDTGGLAVMLKNAARSAASLDAAIHGAIGRISYLAAFMILAAALTTFMTIKIVPAYVKIFADFHTPLPPVTLFLVRVFYSLAQHQAFILLAFLGLFALFLYVVGRYTDAVRWDPPLLRRFGLPLDGAVVLQALAEAVAEHRSLQATLASLARQYPKSYIRRYLAQAERRVTQGVNWCDSLQSSGLVSSSEAGVLKAADRVGNLVWALNDMAERLVRKFTTRLTLLMSMGFPLFMLLFAGTVLLIAAGMIYPLAKLIIDLA